MIDAPPVSAGAVQDTTLCPFAASVADTPVGAPGTVVGVVTELDASDARLNPYEFSASTVNV